MKARPGNWPGFFFVWVGTTDPSLVVNGPLIDVYAGVFRPLRVLSIGSAIGGNDRWVQVYMLCDELGSINAYSHGTNATACD